MWPLGGRPGGGLENEQRTGPKAAAGNLGPGPQKAGLGEGPDLPDAAQPGPRARVLVTAWGRPRSGQGLGHQPTWPQFPKECGWGGRVGGVLLGSGTRRPNQGLHPRTRLFLGLGSRRPPAGVSLGRDPCRGWGGGGPRSRLAQGWGSRGPVPAPHRSRRRAPSAPGRRAAQGTAAPERPLAPP